MFFKSSTLYLIIFFQIFQLYRGSQFPLVSLHRYYNGRNGDHFYTTSWNELGGGRGGYKYEGLACKLPPAGSAEGIIPLHRYYSSKSGDHFYTTNWNELGGGRHKYVYEGVAGYCYAVEDQCELLI